MPKPSALISWVLGMNDQKVDAQVLAGSRLLDKAAVSRVTLGIMLLALGDLCLGLFELTVAGQVNRIDIAATRAADACNDLKALKLNLFRRHAYSLISSLAWASALTPSIMP